MESGLVHTHLFTARARWNLSGMQPSKPAAAPSLCLPLQLRSRRPAIRALCMAGEGHSGGTTSILAEPLGFPGSSSHSNGTLPVAGQYTRQDCPSSSLPAVYSRADGCHMSLSISIDFDF